MTIKLQYKEFEPGEYTEIADRSFEATISTIRTFPWEEQREQLKVSLTNPSVTIEDGKGNFLKLALFYGGKFVLHYFDTVHQLFTKSLTSVTEADSYIQQYFSGQPFDTTDLRHETTWFQHNLIHFATQDFHYQVTRKRVFTYLASTSDFSFLLTIVFVILFLIYGLGKAPAVLMALILFLFGGGLNLILFFNYYLHARGKLLIMSRGNPQFWFGDAANPELFNKDDIAHVTENSPARNSRNPLSGFRWIEINMKSGKSLAIPNLLIDADKLENKLYQHPPVLCEGFFPLIPSSASSPS